MAATIGSALNHHLGRGVAWKGRAYRGRRAHERDAAGHVEAWSGKDRGDENFPVGSLLIRRDLRPHVHAFYAFARNADDIADSPVLPPEDKIARLDAMEDVLLGRRDGGSPSALRLRASLAATGVTPRHSHRPAGGVPPRRDQAALCGLGRAATIIAATRRCRSGGTCSTCMARTARRYAPSDALCISLQMLNHLQDCARDLAALDRCYLPQDLLARHGASVEDLRAAAETPALRARVRRAARSGATG